MGGAPHSLGLTLLSVHLRRRGWLLLLSRLLLRPCLAVLSLLPHLLLLLLLLLKEDHAGWDVGGHSGVEGGRGRQGTVVCGGEPGLHHGRRVTPGQRVGRGGTPRVRHDCQSHKQWDGDTS